MDIAGTLQPPDTAKLRDFLWLGVDPNVRSAPFGGPLLSDAATWGRVEHLDILLRAGADVDAANADGWTPLMVAAERTPFQQPPVPEDNTAAVRFLLDRGADVNRRSRRGWTALMLAIGRGSAANESILTAAGADRCGVEQARFVNAALSGKFDEMRRALAEGADIDAAVEPVGWTTLGWASTRGDAEAVDVLLRAGADVNRRDDGGMTPLLLAAGAEEWNYSVGHLEVVRLLLSAGADVRVKGPAPLRWSALAMAMHEDADEELQRVLADAGAGVGEARSQIEAYAAECLRRKDELPDVSNVFSVIQHGRNDLLRDYLARGFQPDTAGYRDLTPLMNAATSGNAGAVRLLLDVGAKADTMTAAGQTALKNAALNGTAEVVRMLLGSGAGVLTKDVQLALRWAEAGGRHDAATVLRQAAGGSSHNG